MITPSLLACELGKSVCHKDPEGCKQRQIITSRYDRSLLIVRHLLSMPHKLGYPLLTVCIRRKMSALHHLDQLSKMFDVVGASGLTGMISRLSISLISTLQHARRLPNPNWFAGGETAGLFGRVSVVRLCLAGREPRIDRVLKGSLRPEDSRLDFALRSFPPNSLIFSLSSRTFLLQCFIILFTMVATFILTRTFAISALLVGGTSQLARSHTAHMLTERVPSSTAGRLFRTRSLVGRCPLLCKPLLFYLPKDGR